MITLRLCVSSLHRRISAAPVFHISGLKVVACKWSTLNLPLRFLHLLHRI